MTDKAGLRIYRESTPSLSSSGEQAPMIIAAAIKTAKPRMRPSMFNSSALWRTFPDRLANRCQPKPDAAAKSS
jgi:hypothetical protein